MKRQQLLFIVLASTFMAAPDAMAQLKMSGSVTGSGVFSEVNSYNAFRFSEYRDLKTGPTIGADLKAESDTHFLGFFGENIGRDDQFAEFRGGRYGVYKFSI